VSRTARWLERVAIAVASLALSVGLIAVLSGFFAGRDQAGVSTTSSTPSKVPGVAYRDLGHAHLRPGQARPAYDSSPPTSGAHHPAAVRRDGVALTDDQLLQALEVGDVVVFYPPPRPPSGLTHLLAQAGPRFSASLAASGRAVIAAPRPGTHGVLALAWAHMLAASGPRDPALRQFITHWLGHGATSRCC
jgi:hypothetical protein